jgi:hypothetical protein
MDIAEMVIAIAQDTASAASSAVTSKIVTVEFTSVVFVCATDQLS